MKKKWTRRRVVAVSLAVLLAAGIGTAAGVRAMKANDRSRHEPPVALEFTAGDLTQIEARPLARWLDVSGTVEPVQQASVKAKVSGEVREIGVREGDPVRAGQVLARIDTADLEAKLADRVAALEASRAQLALAEKTRAMNLALLKQKFIAQTAFDSSESGYNVALAGVKSSQAQVQLARNALRDAVALSPIAGMVAKRHVQPGEKVAFDSPIVTIVDLRRLELQAMVPAADVPELAPGMAVTLNVEGFDRPLAGRIERINPATEPGTRAIIVYIGIANPDNALRSGMFATGRIALSQATPVPTLPATAVRVDAGATYVWTIEGGKLVRRTIVTGRRDDEAGRVEVRTALPAGAPVLASRFDNLKEGAPALVRAPGSAKSG